MDFFVNSVKLFFSPAFSTVELEVDNSVLEMCTLALRWLRMFPSVSSRTFLLIEHSNLGDFG
jgi:hypothetical protein